MGYARSSYPKAYNSNLGYHLRPDRLLLNHPTNAEGAALPFLLKPIRSMTISNALHYLP